MILGRWQRAEPGARFTPVVFVLRAKKNHQSCVGGESKGEKEVELSLSDLHFFFLKGSKEMWGDQLGGYFSNPCKRQ